METLARLSPTRSVLLRLRQRRRTLIGAAELLERKRQVLAHKVFELLPNWDRARQHAYDQLAEAYRSLLVTRMRSSAAELRQTIGGMAPMVEVQGTREVLSGVPTYELRTTRAPLRPRFGLLGSTSELDRTIAALRDATAELAGLAGLQATLRSLAIALEKTNRQVRTLRDELIPRYDAAITRIAETLDELERAYLFQLKRIRQGVL
jgi:H(+)-transporting ATP synthase subunit D